mmetsp:Transcript_14031/g.45072  ORF Transcript_14031/g.45072 Transcript_14031/m.45072 type:complete len:283 (+) Transcript_14031:23-871(+)
MFFGKDRPRSEGSRYTHPGVKLPPEGRPPLAPQATQCVWSDLPYTSLERYDLSSRAVRGLRDVPSPTSVSAALGPLLELRDARGVCPRWHRLQRGPNVPLRHLARIEAVAQRELRRLATQRGQLGARVAARRLREPVEGHALRERHSGRMHAEDLPPIALVRQRDVDHAVEAARPQQRWVDQVGPVGGRDDNDPREGLHAVHLVQKLREDARRDLAPTGADGRERVDLVEEDNGGCARARLAEERRHQLLRLANPLREELGALDGEEARARVCGEGARRERL